MAGPIPVSPFYGELSLGPDLRPSDGYWTLEVERDRVLTVQVLDHSGKPASGVPIAFLPAQEDGTPVPNMRPVERGETEGPEGLATVSHVHTWDLSPAGVAARNQYLVNTHIPGLLEGWQAFDRENPPAEPIVIQLPPTGRVLVRTVTPGGRPYPNLGVRMALVGAEEAVATNSTPAFLWQVGGITLPAPTRVFERVVANRSYLVEASAYYGVPQKVFSGPTVPDQELRIDLSMDERLVAFWARAVDEQQQPLRKVVLDLHFRGSGSARSLVWTNGEGAFQFEAFTNARQAATIEIARMIHVRTGEPALMGVVRDVGPVGPGDHDLGDIVFAPMPLVATGRVLMDGEPARGGYQLSLQLLPQGADEQRRRGGWGQTTFVVLQRAEEGEFEIRGEPQPGRYRIRASSQRHVAMEPVEFVPGQMGIEINFASAGTVQATILLGDTNWVEALDVRLLPTGGIELPSQPVTIFGKVPSIRAEGHATYLWNGLFPGTYNLEVRVAGVQQPVAYVEGIEVPGGGPSRDPRLGAIDLGGDLRVL